MSKSTYFTGILLLFSLRLGRSAAPVNCVGGSPVGTVAAVWSGDVVSHLPPPSAEEAARIGRR